VTLKDIRYRLGQAIVLIGLVVLAAHGTSLTLRAAAWALAKGSSIALEWRQPQPLPASEQDYWTEEQRRLIEEQERERIQNLERRLEQIERNNWPSDYRQRMEDPSDWIRRESTRHVGHHLAGGHAT
jgi:hypothetical protein